MAGVLWTSVAALAIFVGLGLDWGDVLRDPAFELNCFLTRSRRSAGLSQHSHTASTGNCYRFGLYGTLRTFPWHTLTP